MAAQARMERPDIRYRFVIDVGQIDQAAWRRLLRQRLPS